MLFMPPSTHSSRDTVPLASASMATIMSFSTWETPESCRQLWISTQARTHAHAHTYTRTVFVCVCAGVCLP
jgi:hypothetical protein